MIIAVDVDNVICNLQETVVNLFNQRHNTKYSLNDFKSYYVSDCIPEDDAIKMQEMYSESGLYNFVKPIPGSQSALKKLISNGHIVYLVTDAIPKTYGEKIDFIHQHFPFIDDSHIVAMKHKWLFRADVLVEDKLETLLEKPYFHRVCFNYPWNESKKDYIYDIHRCYDWNDVLAAINKINDGE